MRQNLLAALNCTDFAADWVGFRHVRETTTERAYRDAKPLANETWISEGVLAEVLVGGQFAYAATPRLDVPGLAAAARTAYAQAVAASQRSLFSFSPAERPSSRSQYISPVERPFGSVAISELSDLLARICERMRVSEKVVRTESFARTVEVETGLVSSTGADAWQQFSLLTTDFQTTARAGDVVQRRTDGGLRGRSYQGGWEHLWSDDLWSRVDKVADEAVQLVHAPECPTATLDLLLSPDQMMLQIHESIGHPLEVDRILGDERNYAGWSFVELRDFGTLQYGSSAMTVTWDPTVPGEFAGYRFDDTGTPASRQILIEKGRLLRGLGGIESQLRSGVPGVATQRACSWNRPPIDRMANLNLEPGNASWDELVAAVDDGVWMESNRSWSIDDFRNKFQFGCELGRRVRNGKVGEVVRNPNYRGVTVPFWRGLAMVGDRSTFRAYGTPYCGKGEPNQLIRVGHASPACLFRGVEVFGGDS